MCASLRDCSTPPHTLGRSHIAFDHLTVAKDLIKVASVYVSTSCITSGDSLASLHPGTVYLPCITYPDYNSFATYVCLCDRACQLSPVDQKEKHSPRVGFQGIAWFRWGSAAHRVPFDDHLAPEINNLPGQARSLALNLAFHK